MPTVSVRELAPQATNRNAISALVLVAAITSGGCGLIHQCTNKCPGDLKHNVVCGCIKPK
jgi:hypothetical protein